MAHRSDWALATDSQLLAQCEVDTYRASGPGGQKRNKTSSAVRLRHLRSGIIVIAEESRSQHENRARALRRLRRAFWLQLREPVADQTAITLVQSADNKLSVGPKDARYWPAVAEILDLLDESSAGVREAAQSLGTTTANLIDFLAQDHKVWQAVNAVRVRHGRSPLRT